MAPSLSIIIPIYNGARLLPETVATVLSQSFKDWELLLIDDGSTDGETPSLCDAYAATDRRIHAYHKPNGGLSDARNYGIERAHGKYITFLDADDLLHPDFAQLTTEAAATTDADIVYTKIDFYTRTFKIHDVPTRLTAETPTPATPTSPPTQGQRSAPSK